LAFYIFSNLYYVLITSIVFSESRENAYVHAISAASLAYQVTKACARGELQNCSCDAKVRARSTKGKWQWGGCSEVTLLDDDYIHLCLYWNNFTDDTLNLA